MFSSFNVFLQYCDWISNTYRQKLREAEFTEKERKIRKECSEQVDLMFHIRFYKKRQILIVQVAELENQIKDLTFYSRYEIRIDCLMDEFLEVVPSL